MTTAVEVAQRALKRILVQADDAPLDASDYADFYDSMNAFMAALEGENCVLGYTPVFDAADVITIPDSCIRGLVANMALEVSPDYGVSPAGDLREQARRGLRVMRHLGRPRIKTSYPAFLPIGAGQWDTYENPLYGVSPRCLLTLGNHGVNLTASNNAQVTEFNSDGLAYLTGLWRAEYADGLLCNTRGEVRNSLDERISVRVEFTADFTADTSDAYILVLATTDETIGTSAATGTSGSFSVTASVDLPPGATIQRALLSAASGNPLTVYNGRLKVY